MFAAETANKTHGFSAISEDLIIVKDRIKLLVLEEVHENFSQIIVYKSFCIYNKFKKIDIFLSKSKRSVYERTLFIKDQNSSSDFY